MSTSFFLNGYELTQQQFQFYGEQVFFPPRPNFTFKSLLFYNANEQNQYRGRAEILALQTL